MPDDKPKDEFGDFLRAYDEYLDGKRDYSDLPTLGGGTRCKIPARVPPPEPGGTVRRTGLREELPRLLWTSALWGLLLGAGDALRLPRLALGIVGAAAIVALSLAGVNALVRMGRWS